MQYYSVMPQDWDYFHKKEIKELSAKGCYAPCQVKEVVEHCGSLFPFITFDLMEGKTWGEMELVQSF